MSLPLATLDRLTIVYRKWVETKLVRGEDKWEKAAKDIVGVASDSWIELEKLLKLGAINAAIWQRQDHARLLQKEWLVTGSGELAKAAGLLLFELTKLNDWRAEIVGEEKFKGKEQV